ncbi:MAG: type II toxin-antitoxin system VapB family antitoxin [Kiritimatiellia bacterium]
MHIDQALLDRVVTAYGFESKTEAVNAALKELDRHIRYREQLAEPCMFTPEQFGNAVAPAYDPLAMRVAEKTVSYGGLDG